MEAMDPLFVNMAYRNSGLDMNAGRLNCGSKMSYRDRRVNAIENFEELAVMSICVRSR